MISVQHFNEVLVIHIQVNKKGYGKLHKWHFLLHWIGNLPKHSSCCSHLVSLSLNESAVLDGFIKWLRKLERVRRGLGRRTDQVVFSNEPCQQYSAYKQIGLTDDTVALLVSDSPANHLSTLVWTPGNVSLSGKLAAAFLSFSPSFCIHSLPPPLFFFKHGLTLFRASWKVISHYFLPCISSHANAVNCQLSAAAGEIMNYACLTVNRGCI